MKITLALVFGGFRCIEDKASMTANFLKISSLDVDISFQEVYLPSKPRLVCFDMDSTLIQTEVIDELADLAGVGTGTSNNRAAMNELDF
jgi:phosphoserine phosphatase